MNIRLSQAQYLELKAMFSCVTIELNREALQGIFYDSSAKRFVATDGYIMRVSDYEGEAPPAEDALILPEDLPLTKAMLKNRSFIDVNISNANLKEKGPYPEYEKVIPDFEDSAVMPAIGIDLNMVARFAKTIATIGKQRAITARFSSSLGAIGIFDSRNEKFLGIIMPIGIKND